eukprot:398931_1
MASRYNTTHFTSIVNGWNRIHKIIDDNQLSEYNFGVIRSGSAASRKYSFVTQIKQQPKQPKQPKPESSLSQTNISKIPATNKFLVFGYIRKSFNELHNYNNLPQLINYLCLLFWTETIDEWDPKNKHVSIIINNINNSVKMKSDYRYRYKSVYLSKSVSSGIHIWTFKYIKPPFIGSMGIHKTNTKLTIARDLINNRIDAKGVCMFGGARDKPGVCGGDYGPIYGFNCHGVNQNIQNKIVKMKVDFKTLTLSYSIDVVNKGNYIEVSGIDKSEYKVGVCLRDSDVEISLISYQHIY